MKSALYAKQALNEWPVGYGKVGSIFFFRKIFISLNSAWNFKTFGNDVCSVVLLFAFSFLLLYASNNAFDRSTLYTTRSLK